jgi:ribosomal protein S18 acetylase RimI-like enzyme
MKLTMRKYRGTEDHERIRTFLREVFLKNDRRSLSWSVTRFDYWCWHVNRNLFGLDLEEVVFLWETDDGRIAAVLNPENPGQIYLQIHPDFHSDELENEMMEQAEHRLHTTALDGNQKLQIWTSKDDKARLDLLTQRGYTKTKAADWHRKRPMSIPIENTPVADGYTIRGLGGDEEIPARSYVSWQAFHPDEPESKYQGPEWYPNLQKAPLYRRDLDLVAVASDGEFAAFCTVWFDDVTLIGDFEPVGTAPNHQRRGLATAVINEGLRRLAALGGVEAHIGSWNEATHRLYGGLGFESYDVAEAWVKQVASRDQ